MRWDRGRLLLVGASLVDDRIEVRQHCGTSACEHNTPIGCSDEYGRHRQGLHSTGVGPLGVENPHRNPGLIKPTLGDVALSTPLDFDERDSRRNAMGSTARSARRHGHPAVGKNKNHAEDEKPEDHRFTVVRS